MCPNCDFVSHNNQIMEQHGFNCHVELRKHIIQMHKEKTLLTVKEKSELTRTKGLCAFFTKPQGCKKGLFCDFSHDQSSLATIEKVRKVCRNGFLCLWKPRCKFVHFEDGEVMPPRVVREPVQGLTMPDLTKPPPNHQTSTPPRYNVASSTDFPGLPGARNPETLPIVQ